MFITSVFRFIKEEQILSVECFKLPPWAACHNHTLVSLFLNLVLLLFFNVPLMFNVFIEIYQIIGVSGF